MKFERFVGLAVCFVFFAVSLATAPTFAQDRDRVIKTTSSRPINQRITTAPVTKTLSSSRPILTNEPVVQKPLIEKTGITSPLNAATSLIGKVLNYNALTSNSMMNAIPSRFGIRYVYGPAG